MSPGRLKKLKAMDPAEVVHRAQYAALTTLERRAHRRGQLTTPHRLRAALARDLRVGTDWADALLHVHPRQFFAWEDDADRFRSLFASRYGEELDKAREEADSVERGEVHFFGETFRFGQTVDWHADPVSGKRWPQVYHRDVPVHGGDTGFGDVKYVWELNRHQFLVDLAKTAFLDKSAVHANALCRLLKSWQTDVPYATGAPWACALEPAFRVWSWLWAYRLLRSAHLLSDGVHLEWLGGFYDHGRFLNRHLEVYSSPYNHLVGEASALFALGVIFPAFEESSSWVRRGQSVLESTLARQFHQDGGSVEQSTFYHHATLGFYLLAAVLGRRNHAPLSPEVWQAIERGIEFSMCLAEPDGRLPRIGGADDGKPIRLEHLPFWDFRPYQAIGAVLFSRQDFRYAAKRFWEDSLWILGPDGAEAFQRLPGHSPPSAIAFPSSGYYVVRTEWSPEADYVCFDCGEQAAGLRRDNVPSAAHGHADCLSVVVTLAGRQVLVDPGFFCYNGDPEWEVHFRRTRAHNTLTVDGRDQARHISKMAWTYTYAARPEGWSADGKLGWARGSHDGYARGPNGVVHRRTVWLRPEGYVVLLDEILGTGTHLVQANFQFAPGTLAHDGSGAVLFDDRFELAWTCTMAPTASISCGGAEPAGGWIAGSLGVREPAPRLVLEFPFAGPRVALLSVIADRERSRGTGSRTQAVFEQPSLLSARVRGRAGEDWLLATQGEVITSRGIQTDAVIAAVSFRDGRAADMSRIGGTQLLVSGVGPTATGAPGTYAETRRVRS